MANRIGNKREIIINAAVSVFSQKGYHNTTIEEIAVVAGIGKGTVYEYFASKLALFQAMLEDISQTYIESLTAEGAAELSFAERLHRLIGGHLRFCQEKGQLTKMLFWEHDIWDEELKEWGNNRRRYKEDLMTEAVAQGITRGELKPVNARLVAMMIGGVLASLSMPIIMENWEVDAERLADQVTNFIMHGIAS